MFTFEMQWPAPFKQGWKQSSKRFDSLQAAATGAADWLIVSAENDVYMEVRLVRL